MINDIPNDEFIKIRAELDSLPANSKTRSDLAIGYLLDYNLPDQVSYEDLIRYMFGGNTSQAVFKWLYLIERSIPYYGETQPAWQRRLLYFVGTYIIEAYLNRKTFSYDGQEVMLRFTKISGDHYNLHTGFGANTADFYIYTDTTLFVDYKFASVNRFRTIEDVYNYYADGKHMHNAKILLSFLEAEETFYLVDYSKDEFYPLPISALSNYITTETIDNYQDPLK